LKVGRGRIDSICASGIAQAHGSEILLTTDGLDPFDAVFDAVRGEHHLVATVEPAKKLTRSIDLDSRDQIQSRYGFVRGALLALYDALEVRAVRGQGSALEALEYIQQLK
jgi:hypothetical protein